MINRERKIFYNKTKFKKQLFINPVVQNVLEGNLQSEEVNHIQEEKKNK